LETISIRRIADTIPARNQALRAAKMIPVNETLGVGCDINLLDCNQFSTEEKNNSGICDDC
jgi:hypothetical protein